MGVFDKRTEFKPFEYPWAAEFADRIHSSFWTVKHFTFDSDVDDFHVRLSLAEREAVRRAMLAISQVEVNVKEFWGGLGRWFPKPEFIATGFVFADSEVRHANSYSHLLEVLGLNQDFKEVLAVPAIAGRVEYLTKHRDSSDGPEGKALSLILFSLLVENVSLFAQFALMKSVNKHRNMLKGVDNVVQASQQEEQLHALFGIKLVNTIREERPDLFGPEFYERVYAACRKAEAAEAGIIDWMLGRGDLPYLSKDTLKAFVRHRLNESLEMVGGETQFEVDEVALAPLRWFVVELLARINFDFFDKRPVNYGRFGAPLTADSLFE